MSRIGGPIYDPTSQAAGVGGGVHTFARYRNAGGVVAHGLQRSGRAPADQNNVAQAAHGHPGLGEPVYAAGFFDMRSPPVVPIAAGSTRNSGFMV